MGYDFIKQRCAACGEDDSRFIGYRAPRAYDLPKNLQARVVRCRRCGLVYPDPMPVPSAEQRELNYGDPAAYFPNPVSEARLSFYAGVLRDMASAGAVRGRLLDVGCGRGEMLQVSSAAGWEAVGLEPSRKFADEAKRRFEGQVLNAELATAGLAEESFDAITLISVIQHCQEPRAVLAAARRLLKPGGILFIETMNHDSPVYLVPDLCARLRGGTLTTHLSPTFPSFELHGFSTRPLKLMLSAAGLEPVAFETAGGISRTLVSPRGLKDRVLRFGLNALMFGAKMAGRGQVLRVIARRPSDS